jgi:dTMP kinase
VARVIAPALDAGRLVLGDRYFLSTVAYQGARGFAEPAQLLAQAEAEFPLPDLALVFAIAPHAGLARVAARGGTAEPAFEEPDYLARVAGIFASIERPYVARVDARGAREAVHGAVLRIAQERLGLS